MIWFLTMHSRFYEHVNPWESIVVVMSSVYGGTMSLEITGSEWINLEFLSKQS